MTYTLNNYRSRKIDDHILITTDHGSFSILTAEEFKKLKNGDPGPELRTELEIKEIVLDDKNIQEAERELRKRYSFLRQGTSLHIVVTTLRCNMSCVYCHASSVTKEDNEYDMDEATARKTVDFIFQSPSTCITIEFQGGEPMLAWDTIKLITRLAKEKKGDKDLILTIVTNLTEMTDERMKWLIDEDIRVCSSFDGPKEVHDKNRTYLGGSNHEIVTKWVKRFREEYKKRGIDRRLDCLVTLTKHSLNYPKEIVDEYVSLGLTDIHLRYLNDLGIAKKTWSSISYTPEEYLDFWKTAVKHIEDLNRKGTKIRERMVNLIFRKMTEKHDPGYMDLRSPCGAGIGQLVYNHDGDIYSCDEGRMLGEDLFLLGNVKTDKYKDVVTCDNACAITQASINDQYICDNCAYKPYCGVCPVLNYAETGRIITPITATKRCKILMEQFDWVVREKFLNVKKEKGDNASEAKKESECVPHERGRQDKQRETC